MKIVFYLIAMVCIVISCSKSISPYEKYVDTYEGTYLLDSVEWHGANNGLDINGDGQATSDFFGEMKSLFCWQALSDQYKFICDMHCHNYIFAVRFPILVCKMSGDNNEPLFMDCWIQDALMNFYLDSEGQVTLYNVKQDFDTMSLGQYGARVNEVEFQDGLVYYKVDATVYDFVSRGLVSGEIVFTYSRK